MTVSTETRRLEFVCDGLQTEFPISYPFIQESDLVVTLLDTTDGSTSVLVLDTDYSVTSITGEFSSGGTVTTVATYSSDYELIVERDVPLTQLLDLIEGDEFPADSLELALDKIVMMIQQADQSNIDGITSSTDGLMAVWDGDDGNALREAAFSEDDVQDAIDHISLTNNPHSVTAVQVGADPTGTAAAAVAAHEVAYDHTLLHFHANKALLDTVTDAGAGTLFLADDGTYKLGGGAVLSVFGRTGVVVATANDYTAAQIDNSANVFEEQANKSAANGYASLDATGKVPVAELPDSVLGDLSYQGSWNANTNSPALASGVGTKGYYYVVSVAGTTTLDGISDWEVGDWVIYNGTAWEKVDNTDAVTSVFGRVGAVTAQANDYTWAQIDKTVSSLADITTRSAGDLTSGNLGIDRLPLGGTWGLTGDLTIDGANVYVDDTLFITESIRHTGDTNTRFKFQPDTIKLETDGKEVVTINNAEQMTVKQGAGSGGTAAAYAPIVADSDGGTAIQILSPNNQMGYLIFGDNNDGTIGGIWYNHNTNDLTIRTNGSVQFYFTDDGHLGVGQDPGAWALDVVGQIRASSHINAIGGIFRTNGGTEANPAYTLYPGTDCGMYFPTASSVGFSVTGSQVVAWDAAELLFNSNSADLDFTINGQADVAYRYDAGDAKHYWGGTTNPAVDDVYNFCDGSISIYEPDSNGYLRITNSDGSVASMAVNGNATRFGRGNYPNAIDILGNENQRFIDLDDTAADAKMEINSANDDIDFVVNGDTGEVFRVQASDDTITMLGQAGLASISTGAGDNDKLVTQGYVDDAIAAIPSGYWSRTGTVLSPATSGDSIDLSGVAEGGPADPPSAGWCLLLRSEASNSGIGKGTDNSQWYVSSSTGGHRFYGDNGTNYIETFKLTASSFHVNPNANVDLDFQISKNGGGVAYKYDAGTDIHSFGGDVYLDTIKHLNEGGSVDSDTGINFADDSILFNAGGTEIFRITEGVQDWFAVNDNGGDVDFYVRKSGGGNAIAFDAGSGELTIDAITNFQSGIRKPIATKINDYTMDKGDYHIVADGSSNTVDIDLDGVDIAANDGQIWVITCEDKTNAVTVSASAGIYGGGMTGGNTFTFGSQYDSITITYDDTLGGFRII